MSVTNPFLLRICSTVLSAAIAAAATGWSCAEAQTAAAVTDADMERAKRSQPLITDKDIERAQKKHRMPTEHELGRVPIPAAPNLDALPTPGIARPIDLEALAKGYEANSDRMTAVQAMKPGPGLMIFVSFSMPQPTLQRLVDQAAKTQASLVVRGFVNGSLRETVARIQELIGKRQVAFQIDPQAFDRFTVLKTPTFVLVRDGAQGQPCGSSLCFASDAFVAASGDVSLDYALEFMERRAPHFAKDARSYLKKIRG